MFLTNATLTNNATIEELTGQLQMRNATIHNTITGVYNIAEDGDNLYDVTGPSIFNNDGLFEKTGGGGGTQMPGLPFTNSATAVVDVETGTMNFTGGGSSTSSKFIAAAGATINVTGGSATVTWDGTITGTGAGQISPERWDVTSGASWRHFQFPGRPVPVDRWNPHRG